MNPYRRNIRLLYIINFITGLIFTIPVWVAFEKRFLNYPQMAMLEAAITLMTLLLELPTGAIADILGRKKTVIIGYLLYGFSTIAVGLSGNVTQMVSAFLVIGIAAAFISGADQALAYDTHKELKITDQFSKFIARNLLNYRLGIIIATFLGGFLYQIAPGIPYIARGLTNLLAIPLYFFIKEPIIDSQKFTLQAYVSQIKNGSKELIKNSHTKILSIYYIMVAGITWSCLIYFNNSFIKDVGFSETEQGVLYSIIYIITTSTLLYITHKKKALSRNIVYTGFILIMALALLPGIFANRLITPLIMIGIILTGGARFAILDGYINEEFSSENRATALSTLNMFVSLFVILLITGSGILQELYSTKFVFTLLGFITLGILPITMKLMHKNQALNQG